MSRPPSSGLDATDSRIGDAITAAVIELRSADAPTLAEYRPAHRTLLIPRPASFARLGRVWRLGVLLTPEGALFATGAATRAWVWACAVEPR